MSADAAITVERVSHFFGAGGLRKQILFDVSLEIRRGEIVILTGPSGSGKTTLLTLIGALRSTQEGSLGVLGRELCGASERDLVAVRKRTGYIFQAHNLLDSLTALQNVRMALALHPELGEKELRRRAEESLHAVGLGEHLHHHPDRLSGGQKQRVAVARALCGSPELVLADEPTASLDRASGREVVELLQDLARRNGSTVLMVTHDNRVLDIADRIVHLEDGRLVSFANAVLGGARQMLGLLAQNNRKGELVRHLRELPADRFVELANSVTADFRQFLDLLRLSENEAFESMLEQMLEAFTIRFGEMLDADRATLFLVDRERGVLWSKFAKGPTERPLDIRIPIGAGIAGEVATTGRLRNVPDAYEEPKF
ncbi:MAG: ATP-binding cassette domain-containing protein, partial [Candidatus Binatia bacterium]